MNRSLHKRALLIAAMPIVAALLLGCSAQGSAERPTLFVFVSPTCAGCIQDYPVVEKIAGMGLVTVKVVVAEQSPDEMQQWNVRSLPCYIYFRGGQEQYRTHQAEKARRWIHRDNL